jgi:glycosyltransferase involved in cell wall biosynthesis
VGELRAGALTVAGTVRVVMPAGVDDPTAPSGGNTYDRRLCAELAAQGFAVEQLRVGGTWPHPSQADLAGLGAALDTVPDSGVVLLDGLVACAASDVVVRQARRLRLAVLVHLPLADETGLEPAAAAVLDARERRALHAVHAVVTTSVATARRVVDRHGLAPSAVHVAVPGADPPGPDADRAGPDADRAGDDGRRLLCVGSVTPRKGHDVLVEALADLGDLGDLAWTCTCVGPLDRSPAHADRVRVRAAELGLGTRLTWSGPRTHPALTQAYDTADLVVLPSRAEPYGMVLTEALARGLPVVATAVDGVPEAVGRAPDGELPGLLVPPGDAAALAGALRAWLTEPDLRHRLRAAARARGATLRPWTATATDVAAVLRGIAGTQ